MKLTRSFKFMLWGQKRFFNRPFELSYSILQSMTGHVKINSPFGYGLVLPLEFKEMIPLCIVGLFCRSRPSTIIRGITFRVINSINRMSGRWWIAHISKKVFKFEPLRAYSNPYSSISVVSRTICVIATRFHVAPYTIRSRFVIPMTMTMSYI